MLALLVTVGIIINSYYVSHQSNDHSREKLWRGSNHSLDNNNLNFPRIVHQMWKDSEATVPYEMAQWREGCSNLNADYEFRLYLDADLREFVVKHYKEYLAFFDSLSGVY